MLFRKMQRHANAALKLLAVCIILRRACLAQRHTSLRSASTSASSSTTQTVLNDIRNAFKVITNNTSLLNRLIPVMYQPAMQQANPAFLFKIPTELSSMDAPSKSAGNMEDTASGYWMWSMQRSDFTEPTFPNLTVQHMRAQLKKLRRQHNMTKPGMPDFNVREQQTTETDAKEESGQHDDWSLLGLDGWSGAISPPANTFDFSHKPSVDSTYPIGDILMDFGETTDPPSHGADASAESNGGTVGVSKVLQHVKPTDADIYLARVNDPFGYSVQWELRNTSSPSGSDDRTKRDVVKLYSMIQCSTGCNPLTYKGYGCFCGFLGAGLPVDDIDRCCKLHDKCYEHSNCISYLEYFVPYVWKCYRGKPVCAIDHGEWGGPDSCAARLCYCDLRLSRCLRQFVCPRRRAVCTSSTARRLQNLLLTF